MTSSSTYRSLLEKMYALNQRAQGIKYGLENVSQLYQLLRKPCQDIPIIHVAGTNGKGSVSWKIAHGLEATGYRTGLFQSPHISSYRERMRILDPSLDSHDRRQNLIPQRSVEEIVPRLLELSSRHVIPISFFELTTVLALEYFQHQEVDVVVLEVGLGGRLDSTNIISSSAVSVITSIGLDHTQILGHTLEDIAIEKAGIIKPHVPVVVGPSVPFSTVETIADPHQALMFSTGHRRPDCDFDFDSENTAIALRALEVLARHSKHSDRFDRLHVSLNRLNVETNQTPVLKLQQALMSRPPCRFELVKSKSRVILDVAHNAPAIQALIQKLKSTYANTQMKFHFVVGFSKEKDMATCLRFISEFASSVHLVQSRHVRGASVEDMRQSVAATTNGQRLFEHLGTEPDPHQSLARGMQQALDCCASEQDIVVVCGSVYLMAEAREVLDLRYPVD